MPAVQLLHVTDPHLFADPGRELYGVKTAESFRRVVEHALADGPRPDAVIATGDIGDDFTVAAYRRFRETLEPVGAPVYCLPGNHDDPREMAALLDDRGFQYCGRAHLGRWGLVLVDTHLPGQPHGRVSTDGLARLDEDLAACTGAPTLVCLHHPPVEVGSRWLDGVGLLNAADVLAVLDRHPHVRAVVAGHVHQAYDRDRRGVRMLTTPSTCAQFTPLTEQCVMDSRPPGYRRITLLDDGTLETRVEWLPAPVGQPRPEPKGRR
ncbi:MAG: 3',5'-cyclic-AMP phosphodiesterase [Steroidobacteraceae bacterium]